ncbi:MAG: glycosyltransferase family 2 protein [Planctomycetes bacterium]|nr:glycosyltransferase family 2 protein [Planctomycetota bacterium]
MISKTTRLSIVCPAFEEEEVLPPFHAELAKVLDTLGPEYDIEVIYVDDGSRDHTLSVLHGMAAADRRVRYLSLSRNFGHQVALTAGLEYASGDVVISMDSDLQHPPGLIPLLLEKWKAGHDVVLTLREDDPQLGFVKRNTSRLFYRVMSAISDTELRAAAADFRLMTRRAVNGLLRLRETHRFLRGMVSWVGFPSTTIPYTPAARAAGMSKYTLRKMLRLACDGMLSFSRVPLQLTFFAAAGFVALALFLAFVGVMRWGFADTPVDIGWYALMASIWMVGGTTLGGIGVVGEYVGRVYEQVKERPRYLLKDASPEFAAEEERAPLRRAA